MKHTLSLLIICILFSTSIFAQQQDQKPKTPDEMAYEEANRLEKLLKLEPHQVFYVDSILQHDMNAMQNEMNEMQKSGMQERSSYMKVREKWIEKIETAYKKVFTEEQMKTYLKSVGKLKKEKKKRK